MFTDQFFLFQGGIYAIMAFSAKASEARPCPHDPSGFMRVGTAPGTTVNVGAMLSFGLVAVNESVPGASVRSSR